MKQRAKNQWAVTALTLTASLAAGAAFAEEAKKSDNIKLTQASVTTGTASPASSALPTSTFETSRISSGILDKMSVRYFGQYFGPSVGNPKTYQPTETGKLSSAPQVLKSQLGVRYDISDRYFVQPIMRFNYMPLGATHGSWRDPVLRIQDNQFVKAGNFTMTADLRFIPRIADEYKPLNRYGSIASVQITSYQIPSTRWTLSTWSAIQGNFVSQSDGKGKLIELYLAPNVSYQLSKKVSATLIYELTANHYKGDIGSIGTYRVTTEDTDIQIGAAWDVTPNWNLTPYVQLYPGGTVNMDSTSLGMYISGRVL